jgi:zinc transporter ZupT
MVTLFFACSLIIVVTLIGGLPPVLARGSLASARLHEWGEAFARGLFLGLGMLHFLPDAWLSLEVEGNVGLRAIYFTAIVLGILFVGYLLRKCSRKVLIHFQLKQQYWSPLLLATLLTIHSVLEGAALGIAGLLGGFLLLFVAILAHKMADSFALAISMRSSGMARSLMVKIMLIFSLMTPTGLLLGSSLTRWLQSYPGQMLGTFFDFVAGVTFTYLALAKTGCVSHPRGNNHVSRANAGYFLFGLLNMGILVWWG